MKKRMISLFLILTLLCALLPAAMAEGDTDAVVITDAEGLRAMAANPSGSYVLGSHIDMAGVEWKPFAFSGSLDGRGYSIYNLTVTVAGPESFTAVDGNRKEYDTLGVGLFSNLVNASVRDLGILNGRVIVTADQNCFCALLSGGVENSVVENVSVSGTVQLTSYSLMVGVAGLCGFGRGDFRNCRADVTLIHTDRLTNMHCEQFTGGVLATGFASVENCQVKIAGYTSCHGYVHDGGLIGMHFRYFDMETGVHACNNNRVEGFITFFEDNYDRRAYCDPFCGENLFGTLTLDGNEHAFERREVYDYTAELLPHYCENSSCSTTVTGSDCSGFGYTSYVCDGCGYTYTDNYTAPSHGEGLWAVTREATTEESGEKVLHCSLCGEVLETAVIAPHVPGQWTVDIAPDYQIPGRQVIRCTDCGEILEEQEIPPLVRTERVDLSERELKLRFKGAAELHATVFPENADDTGVSWSSSDSDVVSVNGDGLLYARAPGDAVITCSANDGGAAAECVVHVRYSFGQQLIRIFLLGFLWYK